MNAKWNGSFNTSTVSEASRLMDCAPASVSRRGAIELCIHGFDNDLYLELSEFLVKRIMEELERGMKIKLGLIKPVRGDE